MVSYDVCPSFHTIVMSDEEKASVPFPFPAKENKQYVTGNRIWVFFECVCVSVQIETQ